MINVDRWLLPDGVEEILPTQAQGVEQLRRQLLDLYRSWGYELVIPPLLEFTESLFSGVGRDLEQLTLKVTDQLSGRTMGLRADMTPQAARMDAHSFVRQGCSRLCYADHVLHARPKSPLAIRTPLQAGVELFGEAGLNADIEVISLLLESLSKVGIEAVTLDLGHVGVYRVLTELSGLSVLQEQEFFSLLQTKDQAEIKQWLNDNVESAESRQWLFALSSLSGDESILQQAQGILADAPAEVHAAIDEMIEVAGVIAMRYPTINRYFDLSELRGYHYHTGIVFAAYAEGFGDAVANGGRYDYIGECFGRSRPATGFGLNLTSIISLLPLDDKQAAGIYAPASGDNAQWQAIQRLRANGERVVSGLSVVIPDFVELGCDRQLVLVEGEYLVQSV
ncbi:ATP phosphoribosyltransferase regulatory subunit [Candidatus Endobugula sertula]|uniref:ATP phosphoribosyltransferase regulatory subunit n=1 Tax=Candidatus Endobugula sertula TaxID=62101 RepID=A0A1D2QMP9_9GAMM|nr:ATP phosphoribosyltransferase regulatory subunit [Candidatus Endobugula sertula]